MSTVFLKILNISLTAGWLILAVIILRLLLKKAPKPVRHIYSLFFILLGWLIFAADGADGSITLNDALYCLRTMLGFSESQFVSKDTLYELLRNVIPFIIMCVAATPAPKRLYDRLAGLAKYRAAAQSFGNILAVLSLVLCTAYLVNSGYNPFLYFRF